MTEHFLHALDVCSILKHMYCKGMPECMRRDITVNACRLCISLEDFPESLTAHGSAGTVGEQGFLILVLDEIIPSVLHIFCKCSLADVSDRDDPLLIRIMTDNIPKLQIQIGHLQMDQFTYTHACRIEEFQHRTVAKSLRCIDIWLLQETVHFLNG